MENAELECVTDLPRLSTKAERPLSDDEKEKMDKQNSRMVTLYIANKCEVNARKHWDMFYKRNETRFFKDRHWTTKEFKELLHSYNGGNKLYMLEVGCGVGNLIFPLLEECENLFIYACDFSSRAVEFVKSHKLYQEGNILAFEADITTDDLNKYVEDQCDIVTLVFILSAVHPEKFLVSLKNIFNVMKKGGIVLFRDYGIHDMTQIRFKPGHKISENLYLRQDGTRTYFFSVEKLRELFLSAGFIEDICTYIHTRTINMKEGINMPRTFVQAKFMKPV